MRRARAWLIIVAVMGISVILKGAGQMKLTSSAFGEGGNIPGKFTCDGPDTSPSLKIEGAPPDAKSLALIVDDPDAPGRLFNHWLVWNIDPKTGSIAEGNSAGGVEGKNDFGKTGYGGPCPPSGAPHRYFFRIFALDQQLNLNAGARRKELDAAMKGHVVGQGELMGRYARKK